jgi:hypothetical protein
MMIASVFKILLAALAFSSLSIVNAEPLGSASGQSYQYEPELSTIDGKISSEIHWGPPNYGENPDTDSQVRLYFITLDSPIKVEARPGGVVNINSYQDVTVIQITYDKLVIEDFIGGYCTVTGKLYERIFGIHMTNVLMAVEDIVCV